MGFTTSPSGGGGGGAAAPQLPVWTFQDANNGNPDPGKFTTDNVAPNAVGFISIHANSKAGVDMTGMFNAQTYGCIFTLTSLKTGKSYSFNSTQGFENSAVNQQGGGDAGPWDGDYALSISGPRDDSTSFINGGPGAMASVLSNASITPITDNTYVIVGPNSNGSITFQNGICTAFSPGS